MATGKVWENRKFWIGFFAVLTVVILGILIGVLIVNVLNVNNQNGEEENTFPVSMHAEEFEEINELAAEMTMEDVKELYENAIMLADTVDGLAEARVEYGRYLLNNGEVDLAVEQFEQVDEMVLNDGYKILYYAALREYYALDGEDGISDEYNEKIRMVVENSDYAAGG